MEIQSTIYLKKIDNSAFDHLFALLEEGEITASGLKGAFSGVCGDDAIDKLFNQVNGEGFFIESTREEAGYVCSDIVTGSGEEESLLALVIFLQQTFPDCDVRIKGQGEEFYLIFIRQDPVGHDVKLRRWEEEDPEELMELQEWFNEGLPDALQTQSFDIY